MKELIRAVRENPVLYDPSHDYYSRTKFKDELWEQIAKELNYTNGVAAKEQWQKLRECHRESLRRQEKRSRQGATNIRRWTYQKELEFLIPYMRHRVSRDYILKHESIKLEEDLSGGETNLEFDDAIPKKMMKIANTDDVVGQYTENSEQKVQPKEEIGTQNDGLYQFFLSMWNITKSLPIKYQRQVRRKVFEAVSQAEENADYETQMISQLSSSTSNAAYTDIDVKYQTQI